MEPQAYLQSFGLSLDLALEAHALLRGATGAEVPGVKEDKEQLDFASITTITILDAMGEKAMGKPIGTYVTIEAPELWQPLPEVRPKLIDLLAKTISMLVSKSGVLAHADVLIVGLGNWQATPDSLGPRTVDKCFVTRHLHRYASQAVSPQLRSVSAVAPGVLGVTGIETLDIVKGVVEQVHPGLIIAVDALAAQEVRRLGTTIQLSDTGLNPGSGVGNTRSGLSHSTLGMPVLAIGVPTVVQAPVLAYELFSRLGSTPSQHPDDENLPQSVKEILAPFGGELTVTPKEIDNIVLNVSDILALGLNKALFPDVAPEDIAYFS